MFFTINVGGIGAYFFYFHWYLRKTFNRETTIYYTYEMGKVKQINIKNRTYYFYNDQINLKFFDSRLLKVDKKITKIGIYYIGYLTFKKIANCNNINSVNTLHLMINEVIGHFEEKNENKYLVLHDVDKNK